MSGRKPAFPPVPGCRAAPAHHAPPPVRWPAYAQPPAVQTKAVASARAVVPRPPVCWSAGAPAQAKASVQAKVAGNSGRGAPPPGPPPPAFVSTVGVAQRKPVPNGPAAIQRMKADDDDYIPPSEQKGDRYTFSAKQVESLIRRTAHNKKHKKAKYGDVFTCRACGRPLGYVAKGKFTKTKLAYISKAHKKKHEISSAAMDHIKPWATIRARLKKLKKSDDDIKKEYFKETNLRALCKKCNESHKYEGKDVPDYDSDVDGRFDPPTPKNEPENKGSFSMFWDK